MNSIHDIEVVTVGSIARKYDLPHIEDDIVLMDTLRTLPNMMNTRRLSLCLFIGVCTSGIVALTVNEKKRAATCDNVMLLTDDSVVDDLKYSDDFDGFGVIISYKLLQDILRDVRNMSDLVLLTHKYPVFSLREEEMQMVKQYYDAIRRRIVMPEHPHRYEVVRLMLLSMIYDMEMVFKRTLEEGKDERQSRGEVMFVHFIQLVKGHYREQRRVSWYAERMGITPKYLSDVISSVSRRSPNQWIDKFVTAEIRSLLRHTNKSINEISQEMNFSSQSFFGKYFKENVGVSPTDYRNDSRY